MAAPMVPILDGDSLKAHGGHERWDSWFDDAGYVRARKVKWLYNATGAACTVGLVYRIVYDGDGDVNPSVVACAAISGVYQRVAVAIEATPASSWGYFAVEGYTEASCNGTTALTKDDFLKIVEGTDTDSFIDNTTTRTNNSHALYSDDTGQPSSTANRLVYLLGEQAIIT